MFADESKLFVRAIDDWEMVLVVEEARRLRLWGIRSTPCGDFESSDEPALGLDVSLLGIASPGEAVWMEEPLPESHSSGGTSCGCSEPLHGGIPPSMGENPHRKSVGA